MIPPQTAVDSSVAQVPFTVDSIEQQINRAWAELGARAESENAPAPLRTSILTLVVIAQGQHEIDRASKTLAQLVQVLPSRAIQISIREQTSDLSASVSAHCAITASDRTSCYELIHIEAGPGNLPAIPSILTQLDISDLATFLWWVGPVDIRSDAFKRISGSVERVIIDSARLSNPLAGFAAYASYLEAHRAVVAGTDLTWSRLLTLRELVAQSFDMPAAQHVLNDIQRVDMTYNPTARADALLMTGWLSSRLGWQPLEATESETTLRLVAQDGHGREVSINLSRAQAAGQGLRSIRLVAHTASSSCRVTVRRIDDQRAIVNMEMTGMLRHERIVHCIDGNDDQVLGMELLQFRNDPIYEHALHHAAQFAELLQTNKET